MHRWDVSLAEATAIQNELRKHLLHQPLLSEPRTIAGADVSYNRFSDEFFAAAVVLSYPDLKEVDRALAKGIATFPYVPGYLSFREIPTLLKAFARLREEPDIIMCDGQGIAHPRRMGIAAHLGLVLERPTFGVAKSRLYGVALDPAPEVGSISPLRDPKTNEQIGDVIRTKARCNPLIVSAGHLVTLADSRRFTLATLRGYRVPAPTRLAHDIVNRFRRGEA